LFKRIATEMMKFDWFFEQRSNAARELGHSTYQKVTAGKLVVFVMNNLIYLLYYLLAL
jgi:hypothetical protein